VSDMMMVYNRLHHRWKREKNAAKRQHLYDEMTVCWDEMTDSDKRRARMLFTEVPGERVLRPGETAGA
jgi:hypothetical protein